MTVIATIEIKGEIPIGVYIPVLSEGRKYCGNWLRGDNR